MLYYPIEFNAIMLWSNFKSTIVKRLTQLSRVLCAINLQLCENDFGQNIGRGTNLIKQQQNL